MYQTSRSPGCIRSITFLRWRVLKPCIVAPSARVRSKLSLDVTAIQLDISRAIPSVADYENDWPQPQVRVVFGLLIENPAPCSPSLKSSVAPVRYCELAGS